MTTSLKFLIGRTLPLFFVCSFSFGQRSLTTEQINRLADAGKLYGYVKYFHPFLQYKDINWDSSFAASVEGIIKANNKEEYGTVVQRLLSSLDDGLTTVINRFENDPTYRVQPLTYTIKDTLLYLDMNDAPDNDETNNKLQEAVKKFENVKGAIIDLRKPKNSNYINWLSRGDVIDQNSSIFNGEILWPVTRSVNYGGFPSEMCESCYFASFRQNNVSSYLGNAKKEIPLVFILDSEDQVPLIAIKLQEKGKAAIICEQSRVLYPGNSNPFYTKDSLLIRMRTAEAINTNGTLLRVRANVTYSAGESTDMIYSKAVRLILNGLESIPAEKRDLPLVKAHIAAYPNENGYPSPGFRMLAAAKIYSVIDQFYHNKKTMSRNWDSAYEAAIPKFIGAKDSVEYLKAIAEFYAVIEDSHGYIAKGDEWFSLRLNPIIQGRGNYYPPVFTRVVENKILVAGILNDSVCKAIGINKGDIIISIDDQDPMQMIQSARKYQNASNTASQTFYLGSFILFGKEGQIKRLKIQNSKGLISEIFMPELKEFRGGFITDPYVSKMFWYHDKPSIKLLTKDIGYADLTSDLGASGGDSILNLIAKTKAFILDLRGYPQVSLREKLLFENKETYKTPFKRIDTATYYFRSFPNIISANRPWFSYSLPEETQIYWRYTNKLDLHSKIVVLTNETAQSSAESAVDYFKNNTNATVIGSPTAGANAFFVNFNIPGNILLWLSGSHISRRGIQPDILVRPTIKGFQAGKDEVLDRAITYLKTGK
jgi:C-terminal processing protease CtpA/Prc